MVEDSEALLAGDDGDSLDLRGWEDTDSDVISDGLEVPELIQNDASMSIESN